MCHTRPLDTLKQSTSIQSILWMVAGLLKLQMSQNPTCPTDPAVLFTCPTDPAVHKSYWSCCSHVLLILLFTCPTDPAVHMSHWSCCSHVLLILLLTCPTDPAVHMSYWSCCSHVLLILLFTSPTDPAVHMSYRSCCSHVLLILLFTCLCLFCANVAGNNEALLSALLIIIHVNFYVNIVCTHIA